MLAPVLVLSLSAVAWLAGMPLSQVSGVVVAGRVVDAVTGAGLPDVLVQLTPLDPPGDPDAQLTTAEGAFRFSNARAGGYVLTVSSVGYAFSSRRLTVAAGLAPIVVPLAEGTGAYRETVDVSAPTSGGGAPVSSATLGSAALQDLRGVVTDDPMRAIQALPGVATGDDFQAGFSVRGSAFRHAGVVVDGVPAARLMHAVQAVENDGSIAMINTDVLDHAALTAGPQPRRDGEWIGPTLDFRMREGSRDRTGVRAAVSGTSASVVAEGPLGTSRRASWLVSARKSYLDWLIRQLEPDIDSTIGFADAQARVVIDVTARDQLALLVVGGDAVYRERELTGNNSVVRASSGSTLAALSWRRTTMQAHGSATVSFLGSEFRNLGATGLELARGYTQTVRVQAQAGAMAGAAWSVEGGGAFERYRANEIRRRFRTVTPGTAALAEARDRSPDGWLGAGWGQVSWRTARAGLAAGMRVTGGEAFDAPAVQPWLLVTRGVGAVTLRAGIGRSAQPPDVLTAPASGTTLRPETAIDVEAGVEHAAGPFDWRVTAFRRTESDGLRRTREDRLDPATGVRVSASAFPVFASALDTTARGFDVVLTRSRGVVTGWAGYTWARTTAVDQTTGERFDADFDQRHTFNLVAAWRVSSRTTAGAKLRIGSNVPIVGYLEGTADGLRLSAERNRVRLPTYARLDLRASRTFVWPERRLTLFVEIMNVLARENLGQAALSVRSNLEVTRAAERLIPFVPSAGLLFEF